MLKLININKHVNIKNYKGGTLMDFKSIKKQITPWLCLSFITVILTAVIFNVSAVLNNIFSFILIFKPLYYGIAIAYVLNLPMKKIENLLHKLTQNNSHLAKFNRAMALFITIILSIAFFTILISVIIPKLVDSFTMLFNNITGYVYQITHFFNEILENLNIDYDTSSSAVVQYLYSLDWKNTVANIGNWFGSAAPNIINTSMNIIGSFGTWFTAFMLSLYLLSSKEYYITQLRKAIAALFKYEHVEFIFSVGYKANQIFSGFIGGQLVEAVILGVLCYIGMLIFKFPFAELISTIVAITSIVPLFGAMFGMAFGCLLILAINPFQVILFIIYFQILQQFEGNVIYPRVVGGSVGISGIYVLLSLVIFGSLFGLLGMLLAVPLTALIYNLISEYINYRLKIKQIYVDDTQFYKLEDK